MSSSENEERRGRRYQRVPVKRRRIQKGKTEINSSFYQSHHKRGFKESKKKGKGPLKITNNRLTMKNKVGLYTETGAVSTNLHIRGQLQHKPFKRRAEYDLERLLSAAKGTHSKNQDLKMKSTDWDGSCDEQNDESADEHDYWNNHRKISDNSMSGRESYSFTQPQDEKCIKEAIHRNPSDLNNTPLKHASQNNDVVIHGKETSQEERIKKIVESEKETSRESKMERTSPARPTNNQSFTGYQSFVIKSVKALDSVKCKLFERESCLVNLRKQLVAEYERNFQLKYPSKKGNQKAEYDTGNIPKHFCNRAVSPMTLPSATIIDQNKRVHCNLISKPQTDVKMPSEELYTNHAFKEKIVEMWVDAARENMIQQICKNRESFTIKTKIIDSKEPLQYDEQNYQAVANISIQNKEQFPSKPKCNRERKQISSIPFWAQSNESKVYNLPHPEVTRTNFSKIFGKQITGMESSKDTISALDPDCGIHTFSNNYHPSLIDSDVYGKKTKEETFNRDVWEFAIKPSNFKENLNSSNQNQQQVQPWYAWFTGQSEFNLSQPIKSPLEPPPEQFCFKEDLDHHTMDGKRKSKTFNFISKLLPQQHNENPPEKKKDYCFWN